MNKADKYLYDAIEKIVKEGEWDKNPRPHYSDGTPAYTLFVNHVTRSYDLSKGEFPITSLRPIAWKTGIKEIFWIYQDASNDLDLLHNKYNIKYWDEWESKDIPGTIGLRYGAVIKKYDLMHKLLKDIKEDPYGRRHIIDMWQYQELESSDGLNPCAFMTNWNVRGKYLDMLLYQRSGDMLTASGPGGINEVQYSALLIMVARHCGYEPGVFTHVICNEHIYDRHMQTACELQSRYEAGLSLPSNYGTPKLILDTNKTNFYDFTIDDFHMENYYPVKPQLILELGI